MKAITPIIFARVADMVYYRGITKRDTPVNGGSYVQKTNEAHECYNFDVVTMEDGKECCLGFVQLMGSRKKATPQLHIENIVGCEAYRHEEMVDDVTVVFCSKARNSQNMRVVGFYKHATVFRNYQVCLIDNDYEQTYSFMAAKENCVLLPYHERHSNNQWYVPSSKRNNSPFGYGRFHVWYAGNDRMDYKERDYVRRMLSSIENYSGENWMNREVH